MFKKLMNSKKLLKFYFGSEGLNRALDNLITATALNSANFVRPPEYYAEKICALISAKIELSRLWKYLDDVLKPFSRRDRAVLKYYGTLRKGTASLPASAAKEIKRVTVKFTRHARAVARYEEGVKLVGRYYCLIN